MILFADIYMSFCDFLLKKRSGETLFIDSDVRLNTLFVIIIKDVVSVLKA